jgi:outer membrane protein OmpA-like peptidoglycan-associated protein
MTPFVALSIALLAATGASHKTPASRTAIHKLLGKPLAAVEAGLSKKGVTLGSQVKKKTLPDGSTVVTYSRTGPRLVLRNRAVVSITVRVPGRRGCMAAVRWAGFKRPGFPLRKRYGCLWPGISLRHRLTRNVKGGYHYATRSLTLSLRKLPTTPRLTYNGSTLRKKGYVALNPYLYFAPHQVRLTSRHQQLLKQAAAILRNHKKLKLCIQSHATKGETGYSRVPSRRRAKTIRAFLIKLGVRAGRIVKRAYGESAPYHSNRTAAGRAKNRRAVLVLFRAKARCPHPLG